MSAVDSSLTNYPSEKLLNILLLDQNILVLRQTDQL